jgi:polar amino acid transport system substrate-binding protein
MKKIVFCMLSFLLSSVSFAATLDVNARNRPPDFNVEGSNYSGPLKDIMELAAERSGHSINWVPAPFKRSLEDMKVGSLDFSPRTFYREDRTAFLHYLDPVGFQEKDIVFFTKKGGENMVKTYADLAKVSIGVKRGTVFYKQFDDDTSLNKVEGTEDEGLVKMLMGGRFDVMISIDPVGVKQEFDKLGFTDYVLTQYKYVKRTGIYYAASKKRYETDRKEVYDAINSEIQKMVVSGEVDKIYIKHGAEAPLH